VDKKRRIQISASLAETIKSLLPELGAASVEEYVEAVVRSHLQQSGHLSAYTPEEEEAVERHLQDLGYLD